MTILRISKRGGRAYLYRCRWVPKGASNLHGYTVQDYLGVLHSCALEVPAGLVSQLTDGELAQLEAEVCMPARLAKRKALEEAELRERDPGWRIDEAVRLLVEAAERSNAIRIHRARLSQVQAALARVVVFEERPMKVDPATRADRLDEALAAVRVATRAIQDGSYGHAPAEGVRGTRPYRLWAELLEAVTGDRGSLLRALQDKGFAKKKGVR